MARESPDSGRIGDQIKLIRHLTSGQWRIRRGNTPDLVIGGIGRANVTAGRMRNMTAAPSANGVDLPVQFVACVKNNQGDCGMAIEPPVNIMSLRNRSAALASAALISCLLPAGARAATAYAFQALGTLGGSTSSASAINNSGDVTGTSEVSGDTGSQAFYADNGSSMANLGVGATDSYGNAISDNHQVAGTYVSNSGAYQAFGTYGGGFIPVTIDNTFGGANSHAYGVNNNDVVTGSAETYDGQTEAFTVNVSGGYNGNLATQRIQGLSKGYSVGMGINNNGQVVGTEEVNASADHAFVTDAGGAQDLGTLGGASSNGTAINDNGQTVGFSDTASGARHAFMADANGVMHDLGSLAGPSGFSEAFGINFSGDVVGTTKTADGEVAFFWSAATGMINLNALVNPSLGWTLRTAEGINDSGQITGWGYNAAGRREAFVLSPIPLPATLPLLLAGVGSLVVLRRRTKSRRKAPPFRLRPAAA